MNLDFSAEDIAFRDEIRAFLSENLPKDIARRFSRGYHPPKKDLQAWQAILHKRGWSVPHWPVEHGGTGWSPIQQYIFDDECLAADAPPVSPFGTRLVGPVIYTFGSDSQKKKYLPAILSGETLWCQGFSEPGSGSDLASLQTRAVRDGADYVVNGRKIWTTDAHFADMMFCLARTSQGRKQQEGISFLLLDMKDPGVTVRPIRTLDAGHTVNEVFIDNVKVSADDLVGQEGKGWSYAKFLLDNERTVNAFVHHSKRAYRRTKKIAQKAQFNGQPLFDVSGFRNRAARLEIELRALEWGVLRMLHSDVPDPTAAASALKLKGCALLQNILDLALDALGLDAIPFYPDPEQEAVSNFF
ncbi:acyl-CoA dehydrogenase family protein [Bradyrhizobium sp. AS23.2]|uniref:acyl-CoA dehydrogenase family protein n=1 Tax=Bradyrhizobium sp. AS23.2 TaxID=1680155 RepID=UPI000AE018C8|nr:acyl-CoA dehydrogenase family protein [Bradyrhizobium sp. AS23.2]